MQFDRIIENLVLSETLRLVGPEWNNTLVRNVIIEGVSGDGIMLRSVDNVRIESVTIRDVTGDGIKLSTLGSTSNVVITDSLISGVGDDGINASQRDAVDHRGLQILGNTIERTGLNADGSGLIHGIYIQTTDFVIRDNLIRESTDGNGISARSSGEIVNNAIDGAFKSGIAYFADNAPGPSDQLLISGNVITNVGRSTDRAGIDLLRIPNADNVVSQIMIYDNTVGGGAPAVEVAPRYDAAGATVTQNNNTTVDATAAEDTITNGAFGGGGSLTDIEVPLDPRPGAGLFPDMEQDGNMRLTFFDDGLGQTEITLSHQEHHIEAYRVDPGTEIARALVQEMGLRITAQSDDGSAVLAVDAGQLTIKTHSDEGGPGISGDETLVFELGPNPVGKVGQVVLGLGDIPVLGNVRFEFLNDGRTVTTLDRAADEIMEVQLAQAFNQVRISSLEDTEFSLVWVEFGAPSAGNVTSLFTMEEADTFIF